MAARKTELENRNRVGAQFGGAFNPWASITGGEFENPFSGQLQMKQGEGLVDFRNRLAQQSGSINQNMLDITDPTKNATAIKGVADQLTQRISGDQAAGTAMMDVEQQFGNQTRANNLQQSRMGLDPSQGASRTSAKQLRISQAVAKAGAAQKARRQTEQSNINQFQSNVGVGANLVGQQTRFQLQQGLNKQDQFRQMGTNLEQQIGQNRLSLASSQFTQPAINSNDVVARLRSQQGNRASTRLGGQ